MNNLHNLINNSNVNSNSKIEKIGDLLLAPSRIVFGGKKFVLLEKDGNKFRYESPESEKPKWVRIALRIIAIPGLILVPLGLLIKEVSLINKETRNAFSEWKKPLACIKKKDNLNKLFKKCSENDLIKELFFEIVSHTERYLNKTSGGFISPSYYEFEPLGFTECACNNQAFDRFKSSRRVNLESRILEDIFKNKPDKDQPINLLSMGCGGLLQDWIVMGHLLKAGYENINITLVDPDLDSEKLQQFTKFFETAQAGNINISHFDTIDKVEDHSTFDAVMAIDFDGLLHGNKSESEQYRYGWEDIVKAQGRLKHDGGLYLGYAKEDFVIKENNKIETLGKPGIHSAISKDIKCSKEIISIAVSQCMIAVPMLLPVITKLAEVGVKEIHLTLVGKDDNYGSYPNVKAVGNIINGYAPKEVTININHTDKKLDSQQKFDYIVTGELEDITENNAACTTLLENDGVVYMLRNLPYGGAIDKLTKASKSRLLQV